MVEKDSGPNLILWGDGTSRARAMHWMLHELDLDYEKRLIGARTGETHTSAFLRLNPGGKIPVLEDGELVLTESAAIITYLAEKYGQGTGLVPPAGSRAPSLFPLRPLTCVEVTESPDLADPTCPRRVEMPIAVHRPARPTRGGWSVHS